MLPNFFICARDTLAAAEANAQEEINSARERERASLDVTESWRKAEASAAARVHLLP